MSPSPPHRLPVYFLTVDLTVTRYLVICRIKQYLSAPDTYWNAFLRLMRVPQLASPSMLYSRLSPAVYFIHSSVHVTHTLLGVHVFFSTSSVSVSQPFFLQIVPYLRLPGLPSCQSVCVCVLVGCHFWLIVIVSLSPIFLSTVSPWIKKILKKKKKSLSKINF